MKYTTTDADLPYVAVNEHYGETRENRVQAAFKWAGDCVKFCEDKGENIYHERIYTPLTRDGGEIIPKRGGHGYNILDALERADRNRSRSVGPAQNKDPLGGPL